MKCFMTAPSGTLSTPSSRVRPPDGSARRRVSSPVSSRIVADGCGAAAGISDSMSSVGTATRTLPIAVIVVESGALDEPHLVDGRQGDDLEDQAS